MNKKILYPQINKIFVEIKKLGYDFSNYKLQSFIEWLEKYIAVKKKLLLIPQELEPHEFGGWVTSEIAEFFFYEAQTPWIHQEHIILHEVSHWLCGHNTMIIELALAQKMLQAWPETQFPASGTIQMRSTIKSDKEEIEAEALAYLIKSEVTLYQKKSQNQAFATYLKSMGLF